MVPSMTDRSLARLAYAECRLVGDDETALWVARNNPDAFDWQGELPCGWDDGNDWSTAARLTLEAAGIIVWDDATASYQRPAR
jgi:hypothetical protein